MKDWTPSKDYFKITTIDTHTAGEPFRVITSGIPELPGDTMLAKRRYLKKHHDDLRTALMWEPRGHADMYGCIVTPPVSAEADFAPRHGLDDTALTELMRWSEADFLARTEGSAMRRIKYWQWLRNVAVALGNAPPDPAAVTALREAKANFSGTDEERALVDEHINWALERQTG